MCTNDKFDSVATTIARLYNARARRLFDPSRYYETVRRQIDFLEEFIPSADSAILDVGCGRGFHLAELCRRGYRSLVGIDLSKESIAVARRTLTAFEGGNLAKLRVADFRTFEFWREFDVVYSFLSCFGSFGRAGDCTFLKRVKLVLQPRGRFVLHLFNPFNLASILGRHEVHYSRSSEIKTITTVRTTARGRRLLINQVDVLATGKKQRLLTERLRLYRIGELREMFFNAELRIQRLYGSLDSSNFPRNYRQTSDALVVVAGPR